MTDNKEALHTRETYENDLKIAERILKRDLAFLSKESNDVIFTEFLYPLERELAANNSIYKDVDKIKRIYARGVQSCVSEVSDGEVAKSIIKRYSQSVFGIFTNIIELYATDIFILKDKLAITSGANAEGKMDYIYIEPELLVMYKRMVDFFVRQSIYTSAISKTKFDVTHPILDYAVNGVRFNVVHGSLNADRGDTNSPIIALRKQLIERPSKDDGKVIGHGEEYLMQVCNSPAQRDFINKIALNGSYIIFGETGSGKTTLMRYMGEYKIDEKRNLITIEDTPELHLSNNISYLTSREYDISSLFKVTLRENPSHLLIGETRNEEIVDILESSLVFRVGTTLHADSFEKVIMRINFLIKKCSNDYSSDDINSLITAGIDGFIYMKNHKVVEVRKRKQQIDDIRNVSMNYENVL